MSGGRPHGDSREILKDELLFQRATQVDLWTLSMFNALGIKYGLKQTFGADCYVLRVYSRLFGLLVCLMVPRSQFVRTREPLPCFIFLLVSVRPIS